MAEPKNPTHRAYCVLRPDRRVAGYWKEAGTAHVANKDGDLKIYLEMLPVTGFDGHVLLRRLDAKPDTPFPPDPEDDASEATQDKA